LYREGMGTGQRGGRVVGVLGDSRRGKKRSLDLAVIIHTRGTA